MKILHSAELIELACEAAIDWEIDLHFTNVPVEFERAKEMMFGWTESIVFTMQSLIRNFVELIESNPNERSGSFNIQFRTPLNKETLAREIKLAAAKMNINIAQKERDLVDRKEIIDAARASFKNKQSRRPF